MSLKNSENSTSMKPPRINMYKSMITYLAVPCDTKKTIHQHMKWPLKCLTLNGMILLAIPSDHKNQLLTDETNH